MLSAFFKSLVDQDPAPVVICGVDSVILYMNPASVQRYGGDLTGRNLKDCHNRASNESIDQVLSWFAQSLDHNRIYTSRIDRENKDVYMVALRDETGKLIGYYEKQEARDRETAAPYGPLQSCE